VIPLEVFMGAKVRLFVPLHKKDYLCTSLNHPLQVIHHLRNIQKQLFTNADILDRPSDLSDYPKNGRKDPAVRLHRINNKILDRT
ncbi:MAG: hypothetical protein IJ620_04340, partial [Bacteroidales bacterium]|nr:hypothetical protein [Bacteroidales bacterium]